MFTNIMYLVRECFYPGNRRFTALLLALLLIAAGAAFTAVSDNGPAAIGGFLSNATDSVNQGVFTPTLSTLSSAWDAYTSNLTGDFWYVTAGLTLLALGIPTALTLLFAVDACLSHRERKRINYHTKLT